VEKKLKTLGHFKFMAPDGRLLAYQAALRRAESLSAKGKVVITTL
jgi:hypothetical protein